MNRKKKIIIVAIIAVIFGIIIFLVMGKNRKLQDYGGIPESSSVSSINPEAEKEKEMAETKKQILQDYPDLTESDITSDSDYFAEYMDGGE